MDNTYKINSFLLLLLLLAINLSNYGQEANTNNGSGSTYHNQLYFNRFFINPTFSLVREHKSYLNILHRNQYATFDDNSQNYFLGFSNKLNENTALGIGVYSQWAGVVQEFGFNANYATAVRLGANSKLAFGANVSYFNQGLDKNRVISGEVDPEITNARKESKISIQPGMNLSLGKFDFGVYATDLFKYNQTTNEFLTELSITSVRASVQYNHVFKNSFGLFKDARLMPLLQAGQNLDGSLYYFGSVVLDMPNYGWLQTSVDEQYGVSAGVGFNLNKKMSLGYLMEKDIANQQVDLGWNHEISLAYTFKDTDLGITVADSSNENKIDGIVRNYEEQITNLIEERDNALKNSKRALEIREEPKNLAYENKIILDELILRQDSIEEARIADFEQRFEMIVRMLRNDINTSIKNSLQDFSAEDNSSYVYNDVTKVAKTESETVSDRRSNFKNLPVKMSVDSDIIGMNSGYYVIANVYSQTKYLNAFMKDLKAKGLHPKQFYNKENGLHYVYLADYEYKNQAQIAARTDLNGKYTQEKWIMQVNDATATASNTFEDDDFSRE